MGRPGQPGHQGLVLEDGLQDALGHLGLVGRVRGHELRPTGQGPGDGRDLVVVGAAPGEADQPVGAGTVAVGEHLHVGQHVGLAAAVGQLERALQAQRFGDGGEELVERRQPEEGQHGLDLLVGVRDVGAHATPPCSARAVSPVSVADVPARTNGVSATEAARRRPRCSTSTRVPTSVAAGSRKARAMP